jgi:DNA-binding CsgD family transcriptional regulator
MCGGRPMFYDPRYTTMEGQALSDLIGQIYDCALTPEHWPAALARIGEKMGAVSSYLLIHDTTPGAPEMNVLVEQGVDAATRDRYQQYYMGLNPLLPYLASAGNGELYCCRHLVTKRDYQNGEFYQDFAAPQDWFDYAGITLIREGTISAAIGFTRGSDANIFDDPSLQLLRSLAPHLTRATQIRRLLEREGQSKRDFASVVHTTRFGVAIVDASARLLEINKAAETLLARRDGICSAGGVLLAGAETERLHAAIRSTTGSTLRVDRGPGRRPLALYVMPLLEDSPRAFFHFPVPRAAVFVVDPEQRYEGASDLFGQTYRLTLAERRILDRLAGGDAPTEIARTMKIAMPTVRTHLHRLFEKTGTRRQAELIKLYLESVLPIR